MSDTFLVDWDALNGWRAELVRPVTHEGVTYTHVTVRRLPDPSAWLLVFRDSGFYVVDAERWAELFGDREAPQDWVRDLDGSWLVEFRQAVVMRVDPYHLRAPGDLLKTLPRERSDIEGLAQVLNTALADRDRRARRGR